MHMVKQEIMPVLLCAGLCLRMLCMYVYVRILCMNGCHEATFNINFTIHRSCIGTYLNIQESLHRSSFDDTI